MSDPCYHNFRCSTAPLLWCHQVLEVVRVAIPANSLLARIRPQHILPPPRLPRMSEPQQGSRSVASTDSSPGVSPGNCSEIPREQNAGLPQLWILRGKLK